MVGSVRAGRGGSYPPGLHLRSRRGVRGARLHRARDLVVRRGAARPARPPPTWPRARRLARPGGGFAHRPDAHDSGPARYPGAADRPGHEPRAPVARSARNGARGPRGLLGAPAAQPLRDRCAEGGLPVDPPAGVERGSGGVRPRSGSRGEPQHRVRRAARPWAGARGRVSCPGVLVDGALGRSARPAGEPGPDPRRAHRRKTEGPRLRALLISLPQAQVSQATRPTHVNPETRPARRPLRHVACCLAYVPLVLWATWPLARDGATHVVDAFQGGVRWLSLADVLFVVWSLAWDTHALATAPASLLDGNIFYPARWALARSDTFLGHLPFFAPLYLATGNPVLAHNLTLLAYLVLAAVTMYALAWRWTGRIGPALVAGALFGLAPWRLMVPYVQTQAVCHLPLVLLAGEYVLDGGPRPVAAALGGVLVLAGLSDLYVGILSFAVAAVLLAVRLRREPIAPRAARR